MTSKSAESIYVPFGFGVAASSLILRLSRFVGDSSTEDICLLNSDGPKCLEREGSDRVSM